MSSAAIRYPHLDADGRVNVEGTRYKVLHLAGENYHYGWSAEETLDQHPDLRPEQVCAALTYFYDHRHEMIREMQAADLATVDIAGHRLSRSLLQGRLAGRTQR